MTIRIGLLTMLLAVLALIGCGKQATDSVGEQAETPTQQNQ